MIYIDKLSLLNTETDDLGNIMQYARPACMDCKHIFNKLGPFSCKAFPEGIPEDILKDGFDHKKPYKGDNGIRFEPKK